MNAREFRVSLPVRCLLVCAAIALLSSAALPARADDLRDAEQHFQRAVKLYEERAYEQALVEFAHAYEISPQYRVLFNIAQVHYQLNEYAEAMRAFERYLDEGGDAIPAERQSFVRRELRELRERVGTLVVTTNVSGARVLLDDAELGMTPLGPVTVDIGRHVVRVELEGHLPVTRRVELPSGELARLELTLEPLAAVSPDANGAAPAHPHERRKRTLWTLGSLSLALAAGASTSFALAYTGNRDLDAELERLPPDAAAVASQRDQVRRAALASDVLGACAIAAAAGFVVALVSGPREAPAQEADEASRVRTRIDVGLARLGLSGTF